MSRALILVLATIPTALLPAAAAAQSLDLARTGQQTSYDANTPRRDDGALQVGLQWPQPRFLDNLDGTMTDTLTGLIWLKHSSCLPARDWQPALDLIQQLNSGTDFGCAEYSPGTYDDWRLANLNELESLLNLERTNQAVWLGDESGFLGVTAWYYFSSTTCAHNDSYAWRVDLFDGVSAGVVKTVSCYSWPVRGTTTAPAKLWKTGQTTSYDVLVPPRDDGALQEGTAWPDPRFSDNGDGTTTDNLTGLVWLANANCLATDYPGADNEGDAGDGAVTWQNALNFVAGINDGTYAGCGAGHTGWRLANQKELYSLVDFSQQGPALPVGHPFAGVEASEYWTSSTCGFAPATAWTVDIDRGNWSFDGKVDTFHLVWPVRAGILDTLIFSDGFEQGGTGAWSATVQ